MKKPLLILLTVLMATLAAHADVAINSTNFPDANFRSYLMSEYPSGVITTAQLNARTTLEVNSKRISNMKGVEYFTELTRLSCYGNKLTSIDVSSNTKLTYLNLFENQLTSIDVSNNTALEQLYLHYNQLTSVTVTYHSALRTLWVQQNPYLTSLSCYRNVLTNFNVEGCTALKKILCYENPNLATITGLGTCTALTYLDCEDCAITSLSGLTTVTNLEYLYARYNQLTTLDVSGHHQLKFIRLVGNDQLTKLYCNDCVLTTLNLNGCTALTELNCHNNPNLEAISGLADCSALKIFSCYSCSLTDLSDLNSLNNLTNVVCSDNKITSLTLNNKNNLTQLWVDDNDLLTSLNCSNNSNLIDLNVTGSSELTSISCNYDPRLEDISGLWSCTELTYLSCNKCNLSYLDVSGMTALGIFLSSC